MLGTNFENLFALRNAYPATTSACHTMVMLAADLKRSKKHPHWVDINGASRAEVAFDRALSETIVSIRRETGETNPTVNLAFLKDYLVRFSRACPNWTVAYTEITEKMSHHPQRTLLYGLEW